MKTFEKKLIATNTRQIESELNDLENRKKYFQDYLTKYDLLGLKPLESKDLVLLFANPKAFLTEQITQGESLMFGGLKMNPEKVFDLIEKPTGTNELIEEIETDKTNQNLQFQYISLINNFVISDNEIKVCPIIYEDITNRFSLFLENENQQEALEILDLICEKFTRLNELHKVGNIEETALIGEYLHFKEGKYQTVKQCVKQF